MKQHDKLSASETIQKLAVKINSNKVRNETIDDILEVLNKQKTMAHDDTDVTITETELNIRDEITNIYEELYRLNRAILNNQKHIYEHFDSLLKQNKELSNQIFYCYIIIFALTLMIGVVILCHDVTW